MTVLATYLSEAEDDIADAWQIYESKQSGLGDRFASEVRRRIDLICTNPKLFGIWRRKIRAVLVEKFPFVIYYRDRGRDVLIVAVQHGKRSARNWKHRT